MMPPGLRLEVPPKLNAPLTGAIEYTVVQRVQQTIDVLDVCEATYAKSPEVYQVVNNFICHFPREASQRIFHLTTDSLGNPLGSCDLEQHLTMFVGLVLVAQVSTFTRPY